MRGEQVLNYLSLSCVCLCVAEEVNILFRYKYDQKYIIYNINIIKITKSEQMSNTLDFVIFL